MIQVVIWEIRMIIGRQIIKIIFVRLQRSQVSILLKIGLVAFHIIIWENSWLLVSQYLPKAYS